MNAKCTSCTRQARDHRLPNPDFDAHSGCPNLITSLRWWRLTGRALQEDFVEWADVGSCISIRPLIGARSHLGFQRTCDLISGQGSRASFGSPVFACAGKTDPPFGSSSRRTRRVRAVGCVIDNVPFCAVFCAVPVFVPWRAVPSSDPRMRASAIAQRLRPQKHGTMVAPSATSDLLARLQPQPASRLPATPRTLYLIKIKDPARSGFIFGRCHPRSRLLRCALTAASP